MKRVLFWLLVAVTVAVYAVMVAWSLPLIASAAGGLPPFDMRPAGYSFEEARIFLAALTQEGNAFYRDVQHRLDIVFPLLQAATLYFSFSALLSSRLGQSRWLWLAPVFLIAIFDWAENAAVAEMLLAGAQGITQETVAQANRWSLLKSGSTTIAFTVLLVALAGRGWLMIRRRHVPGV